MIWFQDFSENRVFAEQPSLLWKHDLYPQAVSTSLRLLSAINCNTSGKPDRKRLKCRIVEMHKARLDDLGCLHHANLS